MQYFSDVRWGRTDRVAARLRQGADPNQRQPRSGKTPLMVAAESHHAPLDMVRLLLAEGAKTNAVAWEVESTALGLAAGAGRIDKLAALLEAGADIQFRASHGFAVMTNAVYRPSVSLQEVVRFLIDKGADLSARSSYGESALSVSSHRGRFDIVCMLLDAGADPAPLRWTGLMRKIALASLEDVAQALSEEVDLSARDCWDRTPWLLALQTGDVSKADLLLGAGAKVDDRGRCGHTNLVHAVLQDHTDMTRWLIANGADVNARDEFQQSALMHAAQNGAKECVRILIEAGADIDAVDHIDSTAINEAETPAVLRLLVEAGANVDRISGDGYWPLKIAAEIGDDLLAGTALDCGAKVDNTSTGDTALHMAARWDELSIARMLLEAGADPNARDVDGWTPLLGVQSFEMARLLLDAGADPRAADHLGWAIASQQMDPEIRRFLNVP